MMNQIIKSPVEEFADNVLPADRLHDLARSLPAHIKPAVFQRNLLNALMTNLELLEQQPGLVFREVSKAAGLGLLLDPQLGEAYIILGYNYKSKRVEPQLRVVYRGLTKLARQSGNVALIYAHEVCAKDEIECCMGVDKTLIHKPKLFTDRGQIIGYYSVIKFRDGEFDFEPMDVDEIHRIRDRTDAWKAYTEKKIKTTPWATDESEMAKKTVIRRLMKRAPQSPEMADALRIEDLADYAERQSAPPPPHRVPPPPMAVIEHKTEPAVEPVEESAHRPPPPPPSVGATAPQTPDWKRILSDHADTCAAAHDSDALDTAWANHIAPHEQCIPSSIYETAARTDDARRGQLKVAP